MTRLSTLRRGFVFMGWLFLVTAVVSGSWNVYLFLASSPTTCSVAGPAAVSCPTTGSVAADPAVLEGRTTGAAIHVRVIDGWAYSFSFENVIPFLVLLAMSATAFLFAAHPDYVFPDRFIKRGTA